MLLPSSLGIPWELRTVLVVSIVFLVPATVLGMVGPVVAKMAVEQTQKAGQRDRRRVFLGGGGLDRRARFSAASCCCTWRPRRSSCCWWPRHWRPWPAALMNDSRGLAVALATAVLLLVGSIFSMLGNPGLGAIDLGSYQINYVSLVGTLAGCALGVLGGAGLLNARQAPRRLVRARRQTKAAKDGRGG